MGEISIMAALSLGLAVGAAIVIPLIRWCWLVSGNQKAVIKKIDTLTAMHLDKDSLFSTIETNATLRKIAGQLDKTTNAQLTALDNLARGFRELADRVAWAAEQMTGKKIPPYVDKLSN